MKKFLTLILTFILSISLIACGKAKSKVTVMCPNGTPLVAIAGLIGNDNVDIENVAGADPLTAALAAGSKDIVIAPLNVGAKLFIKGASKYKLAAAITIDNTYVISKKDVKLDSINDLEGKTILAYSQNNTPDLALKTALKDINATIDYVSDITTAVSTYNGGNGDYDYCLIAEPQLSKLKAKLDLNVLDLSKVLGDTIFQACIFVNPDANQKDVDKVIKQIEENISYLNEKPAEYAKENVSKNAVLTALTEETIIDSIPTSNITFLDAKTNKEKIEKYFTLLNKFNAKILDGSVTDEFYR